MFLLVNKRDLNSVESLLWATSVMVFSSSDIRPALCNTYFKIFNLFHTLALQLHLRSNYIFVNRYLSLNFTWQMVSKALPEVLARSFLHIVGTPHGMAPIPSDQGHDRSRNVCIIPT